jgi:hypothetical protein
MKTFKHKKVYLETHRENPKGNLNKKLKIIIQNYNYSYKFQQKVKTYKMYIKQKFLCLIVSRLSYHCLSVNEFLKWFMSIFLKILIICVSLD